ncbi:MAG: hypothetical protein WCO82_04105 [Sphingomonadales bacterium]
MSTNTTPPCPAATAPPARRHRQDGWTAARQVEFLRILSSTGSVTQAARRVGMSRDSAYRLRQHPAATAFAQGWQAALATAWVDLAPSLLERAMTGDTLITEYGDGRRITRHQPAPVRLVLGLLALQERMADRMGATRPASDLPAAGAALAALPPDPAVFAALLAGLTDASDWQAEPAAAPVGKDAADALANWQEQAARPLPRPLPAGGRAMVPFQRVVTGRPVDTEAASKLRDALVRIDELRRLKAEKEAAAAAAASAAEET